jgi:bifunctional DNA-binding transcriptional regulator/antitoxin component of YhaV-PrlF toxin-antitoxin module
MTVMSTSYVMKMSANGQISIPAEARARWRSEKMLVVDLGDRVVVRPLPSDPVGALVGKHRRTPSSDQLRRRARREDAAHTKRRTR